MIRGDYLALRVTLVLDQTPCLYFLIINIIRKNVIRLVRGLQYLRHNTFHLIVTQVFEGWCLLYNTIMMTMGLTQLYHLIIHECCWMLFKVLARLSSIYQGRFSRLWYLIVKRSSSRCLCFICYFPSVTTLQSLNIWFKEISIVRLLRVKAHINCTLFWNICLTTAYTSFIIYRDFINSFFNLRPFFHSLTPLDQS